MRSFQQGSFSEFTIKKRKGMVEFYTKADKKQKSLAIDQSNLLFFEKITTSQEASINLSSFSARYSRFCVAFSLRKSISFLI